MGHALSSELSFKVQYINGRLKMKSSTIRVVGLVIAVAAFCLAGGPARADTMVNFRGTLPANVYLQGYTNGTVAASTDYNHTVGGTHPPNFRSLISGATKLG